MPYTRRTRKTGYKPDIYGPETREQLHDRVKGNPAYKLWLSGASIQKEFRGYPLQENVRHICLMATEVLHWQPLATGQSQRRFKKFETAFATAFPDGCTSSSEELLCIRDNWRQALVGDRRAELKDIQDLMVLDGHSRFCAIRCMTGLLIEKLLAGGSCSPPICLLSPGCRLSKSLSIPAEAGSNWSAGRELSTITTQKTGNSLVGTGLRSGTADICAGPDVTGSPRIPPHGETPLLPHPCVKRENASQTAGPLGADRSSPSQFSLARNSLDQQGFYVPSGWRVDSRTTIPRNGSETTDVAPQIPRRSSKRVDGWHGDVGTHNGERAHVSSNASFDPASFYDSLALSSAQATSSIGKMSLPHSGAPALPRRSSARQRVALDQQGVEQTRDACSSKKQPNHKVQRTGSTRSSTHGRGPSKNHDTHVPRRPTRAYEVTADTMIHYTGAQARSASSGSSSAGRADSPTLRSAFNMRDFPNPPSGIPSTAQAPRSSMSFQSGGESSYGGGRYSVAGSSVQSPLPIPARNPSLGKSGRRGRPAGSQTRRKR